MKCFFTAYIGCFAGIVALWAQADSWPETLDYEGRFGVRAPGLLVRAVDTVDTAVGPLAMHVWYRHSPDAKTAPNLFYQVLYVDYPPTALHSDSTDLLHDFFAATIEEAARSVKGEVVYQADREWQGWPGKIWRIDYLDERVVIRSRAVVVRSRFYLVQTVSWREKALNPEAERFFDSFRLLGEQEAAAAPEEENR